MIIWKYAVSSDQWGSIEDIKSGIKKYLKWFETDFYSKGQDLLF